MNQGVCEDHPSGATHTSADDSGAVPPAPIVTGIPERLRALPRWVAWKYEKRDGKPTKVPYNARTLQKAASDDPQTWCAFEEAHRAFERGGFAGIGFVLGDGFVGIDLDKCRNPTTGEIERGAAEIIRDIHSYTEVSPSATGVHIIAEGKLPPGRRRAGNVEMYDSGRYFTITGNVVGDLRNVKERQSEIEAVHARIFGRHETLFRDAAPRPNRAKNEPPACGSFVLDPNANPPFDKFEALRINVPRFARSWEQKRPDMKDHSQSAYDQSLANFAAMAAWTDQEIADLVIANRRMFGADLKLREDYYRRTIAQAREFAEPMVLNEKIAELVQPDTTEQSPEPTATDGCNATETETTPEPAFGGEPARGTAAPDSVAADALAEGHAEHPPDQGAADAKRRALLEVLSARFKVPLNRIVKYTGEPPLYRLETPLGNINLGGVAGLINQAKLRVSIADATGRYLPSFDSKVWPTIAQGLLDACESVDRGADATLLGTMAEWLRSYLGEKSIHATLELADEAREPFRDGGDVIIFSSHFRRWLQFRLNERVTQNRLTADLRAFGAEPGLFKTVSNGRPTTRSAWRLPPGAWIPVTS